MVASSSIFLSRSSRNQFFSALCVNVITISHGIVLGWLSPCLPVLQSENSPLDTGPVSVEEASWIGAFVCIGGLIGNLVFTSITTKIGRKTAISILAFPQMGFWLCVYFGKLTYHLYIGRLLGGITGGGIFILIPLFIADIAEDKIRGTLGSLLITTCSVGILLGYVSGAQLSYHVVPLVMITLPIMFFIGFSFLPEIPQFLLRKNKIYEAEQSLMFYRGFKKDDTLTKEFNEEFVKLYTEIHRSDSNGVQSKIGWRDFTTKQARKGLFIGTALMVLNQFCGSYPILSYTANIFKESGSDLSPNMAAIIVGVIQLLGSYLSTILVDKAGRKILLIISLAGTALGLATFGGYSYFSINGYDVSSYGIVPIASLSFVVFVACLGIVPLPFVVLAEVLPAKIRSFGSSLCMILISVLAFLTLKFFPVLIVILELYGCMFIFSTISIIGTIFIIVVVPETKGKSLNDDNELNINNSSIQKF